jgi:hypothetical protein
VVISIGKWEFQKSQISSKVKLPKFYTLKFPFFDLCEIKMKQFLAEQNLNEYSTIYYYKNMKETMAAKFSCTADLQHILKRCGWDLENCAPFTLGFSSREVELHTL